MASRNDITKDKIQSKPTTDKYREGMDRLHRDEETTVAFLHIEINLLCPYCYSYIDLIGDTNLNEEGSVLKEVVLNNGLGESHETFERKFNCPECEKGIHVKGIET